MIWNQMEFSLDLNNQKMVNTIRIRLIELESQVYFSPCSEYHEACLMYNKYDQAIMYVSTIIVYVSTLIA